MLAEQINTDKLTINETPPNPDTAKPTKSIGTAKILAGQTFVEIETTKVTTDSRIFVTATTKTDKVLSVTEKIDKDRFKVEIPSAATEDIKFNWWIVN